MSNRGHVIKGTLVYTCNCGWIDMNHLGKVNTPHSDIVVGQYNLWKQLKNNGFKALDTLNGKKCFRVIHRQKQGGFGFKDVFGETRAYLIRSDVSMQRKKEIAVRILLDVTNAF